MIVVTGTKRSGTSMWMQVLDAGGFPWIGERYLGAWDQSIKDANPRGFYESRLRQGVFFATNPDPKTGAFLRPAETRRHAVKVFVPGLVRTDFAYLDRVVATMRPWREYVASIRRLYAMEDAFHDGLPPEERERARAAAARGRPRVPPEVEWWFDHYELLRDVATRRYAFHLTTYHRMLADPGAEIRKVFDWLGGGDVDAAVAAVAPTLRTQDAPDVAHALSDEVVEVMDALYDGAHAERGLSAGLVDAMNRIQRDLVAAWGAPSRDRLREDTDAD